MLGANEFFEISRMSTSSVSPEPDTTRSHIGTERVFDELDSFQAVIESKLNALEQSGPPAAAKGRQSIRQLLPLIALTAIVTCVATLVLVQLAR